MSASRSGRPNARGPILRSSPRIALVLTVMLLAAGCLGRSPSPEHYMLGTQSIASDGRAAPDLALVVGPVRLPAYLDRPQFARLEGQGQFELDEFARWLGGFEDNFLRALSRELIARMGSIKITPHPSQAPFPFDARLRLHVDDLVVQDRVLRVRIRWALIGAEKGAVPILGVLDEQISLAGRSNVAIVAAHDQAVALLAERITAALAP